MAGLHPGRAKGMHTGVQQAVWPSSVTDQDQFAAS